MPAMLDDPLSPTIHRVSGAPPFPSPSAADRTLPRGVRPRSVTLRDRQSIATIIPLASHVTIPVSLLAHLADQLNREIDGGDTYPMMDRMAEDFFAKYWFQNFGAIMLLGDVDPASLRPDTHRDWARECLGSFYIKPNYPGRSSHVCNAGFLVTGAARNRGVGRLMGEAYLDWAPRLGYTYSVFNLVYETNVASCRIWDGLGFKRIGRVKGCGNLRSYPDRLIDAIIYGRELTLPEDDGANDGDGIANDGPANTTGNVVHKSIEADGELVSDERFDKIRFYLKTGRYPTGADRAEKSRLRSAATHYKLLPADDSPDPGGEGSAEGGLGSREPRLMLRDKEVISDPSAQTEIARAVHVRIHHGGINKTTSTVADKYHWSRIKETVNEVIQACPDCNPETKRAIARGGSVGGNSGGNGGRRIPRGIGSTIGPTTAITSLSTMATAAVGGGSAGLGGTGTPSPSISSLPMAQALSLPLPSQSAILGIHPSLSSSTATPATPAPPAPPAPPLSPVNSLVNVAAAAAAAAAGSSPVGAAPPPFTHHQHQHHQHHAHNAHNAHNAQSFVASRIPSPTGPTPPSARLPLSLPSQHLMTNSSSPYAVIQPAQSISPLSAFTPTHVALSPSSPGPSPHHPHHPHHHAMQHQFSPHHSQQSHHHHHHQFQPIDPRMMAQSPPHHGIHHPQHSPHHPHHPNHHDHHQHHHQHPNDTFSTYGAVSPAANTDFQALISASMMVEGDGHDHDMDPSADDSVDDADLDMLINDTDDHDDDGDDGDDGLHRLARG